MLVNDIIEAFNIKTKTNVSNDTVINYNDIETGKYFPKFKDNENLGLILTGLTIINNEIACVKVLIEGIEFSNSEEFPPCGGKLKLPIIATFSLCATFIDGHEEIIANNRKSSVVAIIRVQNSSEFRIENGELINETPNSTSESKYANVTASYYYQGVKYDAAITICQHPNVLSSWLVIEEPTSSIKIVPEKTTISRNGDRIRIAVNRTFTRVYGKKNSCGDIAEIREEHGLVEDISEKCLITSTNNKYFLVNGVYLTISKQDVGAFQRRTNLNVNYLGFTDTCAVIQEEGGRLSYKQELSFTDGKKDKIEELTTSIPTTVKVPIISNEYKYSDDVLIAKYATNSISIISNCDWIYGVVSEDDEGMGILLNVTEKNPDKFNGREAIITITNTEDSSLSITLVVIQPPLKVIKDTFSFDLSKEGKMTSEEVNKCDFIMSPRKFILYEDGTYDKTILTDEYYPSYEYVSTNDAALRVNGWRRDGNDFFLNIVNGTKYSITDTELSIKGVIKNSDGKKIYESDYFLIYVPGTYNIDYKYELCFDEHVKVKDLIFDDDIEQDFNVKSVRHKLVNGKEVAIEAVPYVIIPESAEDSKQFSFATVDKVNIKIKPYLISEPNKITYYIIQNGTRKRIALNVTYKLKNEVNMLLSVILHSNNIGKNIFTDNTAYMLIDGEKRINLNPCWLYPTIKGGYDTAYNGAITLSEGEHEVEVFNLKLIDYMGMFYDEIKFKKKFICDESHDVQIIKIDI